MQLSMSESIPVQEQYYQLWQRDPQSVSVVAAEPLHS